jgi:hypothetical protein
MQMSFTVQLNSAAELASTRVNICELTMSETNVYLMTFWVCNPT